MMFNKYPYTSFSEMNLDYILSRVNDFERRLDEIESHINDYKNYIRDVSIENNAYLKTVNGLGVEHTFAIPSGSNVVFQVFEVDENTTPLHELEVDNYDIYSCSNASALMDSIASGVNCRIVTWTLIDNIQVLYYVTSIDYGSNLVHFWTSEYLSGNTLSNKEFRIENDTETTLKITRLS